MFSQISSSLINDPFGDPGLLVRFSNKKRSLLFDIGDLSRLSPRQILSISHIFITHTHIDHFFGFDRMLRLCLGTNKTIHFFGPPGLLSNVEGKLAGYKWNMLENSKQNLTIHATEVFKKNISERIYQSTSNFKSPKKEYKKMEKNILLSEENIKVKVATLDHGIPCLGFSVQETPHFKILPNNIKSLGLKQGAWINTLKKRLKNKSRSKIRLSIPKLNSRKKTFDITNLAKLISSKSKGQKITYITDVNFSKKNQKTISNLAYRSTHLYIEATFTEKHSNLAAKKHHLTAKQAGQLAKTTKAEKYTLFHHSPRYSKQKRLLYEEAESVFANLI